MGGKPRIDSISLLKRKGVPNAAKELWDTTNGKICANSAVESIVTGILSKVDADTIFDVQVVQRVYTNGTEKDNTPSGSQQYRLGRQSDYQPKRKKRSVPARRGGRKHGRPRGKARPKPIRVPF
jgi:hypothetical protein